jgi:hypothetical protein
MSAIHKGSLCPLCGFDGPVDEDGCCSTCGNGACGDGADHAIDVREALRDLYEKCVSRRRPSSAELDAAERALKKSKAWS